MNVTCPQCATVFRVDPAKVPERGVRARCSVCSGLIAVRRPAAAGPAVPHEAPAPVAAPVVERAPAPPVMMPVAAPPPPAPPVVEAPPVAPVAPPAAPAAFAAPTLDDEPLPPLPAPVTPAPAPVAAPVAPPPPPPAAPVAPRGGAGRFSNPFLQQDPGTRARRLARALISDLVVYHPEKRQRGLAEGNLKELFAEEIRKSWEEYAEQVGEDVATTTPWFTEALNEILAEGRPLFG